MNPPPVATREIAREERFNAVWTQELNDVFADVAPYYDRANYIASLGLWGWFLSQFMNTVDIRSGERVLDVCAGTNAIGIALLKREPTLEVHAIDRSAAMQEVGRRNAEALGMRIRSVIDDVHTLPYPDNTFDVVTLQFASRHLRIRRVASEIRRVLKPGGRLIATLWGPLDANKGHAAVVRALEGQQVDASAARKACSFSDPAEIRDVAERAGFGRIELLTEDGVTEYASLDSFMTGMTVGSPSTRKAVELIPESGRARFFDDVRGALAQYVVNGKLAYPMRTHIVVARP